MKKFAKLMSVVLAIAMLFAMAIPVASVAAEGDKVAITVETVEAEAGATKVAVKVFMSVEPHWGGVDFVFNFDPEKLTFKSFALNPALKEQPDLGVTNAYAPNLEHKTEGIIYISWATTCNFGGYEGYYPTDSEDNTYDYFGTLSFDVAEGATGLQEITAQITKMSGMVEGQQQDIPFEITNGGIQLPGGDEPPVEPTTPVVSGVTEGQEFDLSKEEKPAPTWEPAEATATLNGEPYTAGTEIAEAGDYTLVVTNGDKTTTVNFKVVEGGEEPPEPFEGVEFTVETVESEAGAKNVEVKVFAPTEPHWSGVDFEFNFDPAKLTFKSFALNPALKEQPDLGITNAYAPNLEHKTEGILYISWATTCTTGGYEGYYPTDSEDNSYDYFGTFKFDVAENLEDGLYEITAKVTKLSGMVEGEQVDVPVKTVNGGIKLGADECEHDWVETERVAATCTEPGKITYTCSKCGEIKEEPIDIDPEAHNWVEIGRTPATCAAKGSVQYACSINPDHTKEEPIDIDPDAHAYGAPAYEWAEDNSTCTATMVCANDASHVVTETVNTTSEATEGKTVYTATFENKAFETQTKEVEQTPVEPTTPAVTGITDGQEFDLGKGEKPAPTWEPADATATLNGKPYTAGTAIDKAGDYTLVVTNGDKTTTIKFTVKDSTATNPDQPNTSDLPVAGIAIVALIASAAVVVIARKKRFAR